MILNLGPTDTSSTPVNDRAQRRASDKTFTDSTPCSFGKFRGQPLGTVPNDYLIWLWQAGKKDEEGPLVDYIRKRLGLGAPKQVVYVDPYKPYYWALLADEPIHPQWADIFDQPTLTLNIPY